MAKKPNRTAAPRKSITPARATNPTESARSALIAEVDALAELLRRHDLSELEIEQTDRRILLRRGGEVLVAGGGAQASMPALPAAASPPALPPASPTPVDTGKASTTDGNVSYITSPFVGTFYRAPSPDAAPFVDVGTRIKKGQAICIVEAMKLMNEIEAELEGTIVQILVDNGHPVEYGEPLFKIKVG